MESHDAIPQDLPRIGKGTLIIIGVVVVVLFTVAFFARFIPDRNHKRELAEQAQETADAPPIVDVTAPKPQASDFDVVLPGDARAMQQTAIYARVDGYLKKWYFDIDSHVQAGQLLAEIEAPDTDAQLDQARAALQQAQANNENAVSNAKLTQATYDRYHGLLSSGSVTQQDLETRQTAASQASANVDETAAAIKSAQATVDRLEAQKGFERIVAPFSGTITMRTYDVGARISSTDTAPGHELFDIAETDKLRVFASVPQTYASLIRQKMPVELDVANYPGRSFTGYVARSAGVIDPTTRTLYTELDFDNKQGLLWAGMYGIVHIKVHDAHPAVSVPTSAMIFRGDDTLVALVGGSNKIHFQKVKVGDDLGNRLEVVDGLAGNARVVTNPGETLQEGTEVQVAGKDTQQQQPALAGGDPQQNSTNAATHPSRIAQAELDPSGSSTDQGGNK